MVTVYNEIYEYCKNVMLYDKIHSTIKQNGLIPEKATVIVAVSGGADSVCLLDVISHLANELDITVKCAHLNHNLRGDESDGDEQYVKELCEKYKVEFLSKSVDVMAMAKGRSIEDAAREARYEFFDTLCQDDNTFIATAHTVNDNAETFFINLLRGSGSRGLCGIPLKREKIIRPMLEVTRQEIISHLKSVGLSFRTDSTNADTDYLRNYIRHNVIPVFEARSDINLFKSISKATENLYCENLVLDRLAKDLDSDDASSLITLDDAILYRVLCSKLEEKFGIILDSTHFEAIKVLLKKGNSKEQIRGDIYAVCEKGKFSFERLYPKNEVIYDLVQGENIIGNKRILIKNAKEIYKALTKYYADCDRIVGKMHLRTRRDGDLFPVQGRNGTTRLSKLLKNDGVSKSVRDNLLVIYDDSNNIVFVEGYGVSAEYAPNKDTQNILSIEII